MLTIDEIKNRLGKIATDYVKNGMTVGVGTGSTANYFIKELGAKQKAGLSCKAVTTSKQSQKLLEEQNIQITSLNEAGQIDLTIDGADEIDPQLQVIKGGGGALLLEKMVAFPSKNYLIIADETKMVQQLGKFPLPIEVIPSGYRKIQEYLLQQQSIPATLRLQNNQPFVTDQQNYILDLACGNISDLQSLAGFLNAIPGVVEHGLFLDMVQEALIGYANGDIKHLFRKA